MNAPPLQFVARSDGRLVPFDADHICQSLFSVSEHLGRPDAFLARELTDSVVHFLADEAEAGTVRTVQIAEVVEKVVRELGQPDLARAYADLRRNRPAQPPSATPAEAIPPSADVDQWVAAMPSPTALERRLGRVQLREFSLRSVFARDLAAAHAEGLLTLTTLETPGELASWVLERGGRHLPYADALLKARAVVGECVVLDGPEYELLDPAAPSVATLAREVRLGLAATGLRAVVNLNSGQPPVWADDLARGPLFGGRDHERDRARRQTLSDHLADALLAGEATSSGPGAPLLRVDWHLADGDFAPEQLPRLVRLARRCLEGVPLAFVFDRPRRTLALAEGLDRKHPATLIAVGLHLPRLAEQASVAGQADVFLKKLSSLVRLGLSVAKQKREHLRQMSAVRPDLGRGFLLDRARLLVIPIGLEAVARSLGGGVTLASQILDRLRDTLRHDGRLGLVDGVLDAAATVALPPAGQETLSSRPEHWAGVTTWSDEWTARQQLKAADALWSPGDGGTALLRMPDVAWQPEEWINVLRFAWAQTGLVRLRFVRLAETRSPEAKLWE